jgi:hypothetical protein
VVGEHLGVVFGTAERLDPLGDAAMLRSPVRAGNLTVGDVANERMGEGELALALDGGAPLATDESLSLERVKRRHDIITVPPERPRPEHLSDHSCVEHEVLFRLRETVEPRCDDALERLRKRQLVRRAPLDVELGELLGVERVPSGSFEECLLRFRRQNRPAEEA